MTMTPTGLGIGTPEPNAKLDISSGTGDGIVVYQQGDNTETIQTYIDGHWADRKTYASGCCNYLLLEPDVGNVGIGTPEPNAKLDISSGTGDGIAVYQQGDNTETIQTYIDGHWADRKTYASGCCNYLLLEPDVGNVGIGITAPGNTLHVAANSNSQLRLSEATGAYYFDMGRYSADGSFHLQGNQTGNNNIILAPTSGNVGIGVTPTAPLDVNGGIRGNSSGTVAGSGCSPEGMLAYDLTNHQPVYCSDGAVWAPVNTATAFMNRTWHGVGASGTNNFSYPVEISTYCRVAGSAGSLTMYSGSNLLSVCAGQNGYQDYCQAYATIPPGQSWSIGFSSCGAAAAWELY
jgi:hypothetical protein